MKNLPKVIDGIEFVINGGVRVSSIEVALSYGKRHSDVIRAIEKSGQSQQFTERNFALSEYKDGSGKKNKYYLMTRDGFSCLIMKFTGDKAAQWRESFLDAFNKMESFIKNEAIRKRSDEIARFGCKPMTDALLNIRNELGKETMPHHFSNEHTLIYKIVLGVTKKKWCEIHDIDINERFRDHMPEPIITAIADMQKVNTALIELGMDYQERKDNLKKLYSRRHRQNCLDIITALEE